MGGEWRKEKKSVFVYEGLADDDKIGRCFRHCRKLAATSFFSKGRGGAGGGWGLWVGGGGGGGRNKQTRSTHS